MKRIAAVACILVSMIAAFQACAPGVSPLRTNLNFNVDVPPLPASFVNLDGSWVLAGGDGTQSCLVIQESRVSIVDQTCGADGRGLAARVTQSPLIARAGTNISLSVTFNPQLFDSAERRISFSGSLQSDGGFLGTRRDDIIGQPDESVSLPAVLSRN